MKLTFDLISSFMKPLVSSLLLLLLSRFSRVRLCTTPQMAAHQAPPSLGFSRQEHWSGLPCPSPMHESENQSEVTLSCLTPSDPMDCSLPGPPYTGFSRQEYWSGFPSPRLPQNSETHRDNVFDITALTKLALLCLLRIWCFSGAISSSWHSFHMNCTKMPFVLRLM